MTLIVLPFGIDFIRVPIIVVIRGFIDQMFRFTGIANHRLVSMVRFAATSALCVARTTSAWRPRCLHFLLCDRGF